MKLATQQNYSTVIGEIWQIEPAMHKIMENFERKTLMNGQNVHQICQYFLPSKFLCHVVAIRSTHIEAYMICEAKS